MTQCGHLPRSCSVYVSCNPPKPHPRSRHREKYFITNDFIKFVFCFLANVALSRGPLNDIDRLVKTRIKSTTTKKSMKNMYMNLCSQHSGYWWLSTVRCWAINKLCDEKVRVPWTLYLWDRYPTIHSIIVFLFRHVSTRYTINLLELNRIYLSSYWTVLGITCGYLVVKITVEIVMIPFSVTLLRTN